MKQPNTVTVKILDKEYQVACPEEQQAALVTSARYLDRQMRAIRDTGKVVGGERIAVMAALNISGNAVLREPTKRLKGLPWFRTSTRPPSEASSISTGLRPPRTAFSMPCQNRKRKAD